MALTTRLTNTGTLHINGEFDEVAQSTISVTSTTYFAGELDEITINPIAGGLAKREIIDGTLQVAGEFDEVTVIT